jgi:hypothetical protein
MDGIGKNGRALRGCRGQNFLQRRINSLQMTVRLQIVDSLFGNCSLRQAVSLTALLVAACRYPRRVYAAVLTAVQWISLPEIVSVEVSPGTRDDSIAQQIRPIIS